MRTICCAVALVLLTAGTGFGQDEAAKPEDEGIQHTSSYVYCPWTHALDADGRSEEHWFEGETRAGTMRMYLDRGGVGVVGLFYWAVGDWKPVFLGGVWRGEHYELAAETLEEELPKPKPAGHLEGRMVSGDFVGSWTAEGAKQSEPLRLREVQKPGCEGRGAWKEFKDPAWSFSFSYPAEWHLKREEDSVELTCPDPEAMTEGRTIRILQGIGESRNLIGLERCGGVWKKDCECDENNHVFYCVPQATRLNGMTMLNLDGQEWRVYCRDGGYVGQGEGTMRVLFAGERWVELIGLLPSEELMERLLKSVKRNEVQEPKKK